MKTEGDEFRPSYSTEFSYKCSAEACGKVYTRVLVVDDRVKATCDEHADDAPHSQDLTEVSGLVFDGMMGGVWDSPEATVLAVVAKLREGGVLR